MEPYSLYIHIPFCERKCIYCDFLSFATTEEIKENYIKSLQFEMQAYSGRMRNQIDTIYIGGGTPSILDANLLTEILGAAHRFFYIKNDAEITIEINPGTMDASKLRWLRNSKINRVSLGLQSTHDYQLKNLSRIHNYDEFLSTYYNLRGAGIENINVDLMFGLPWQSVDEFKEDIQRVLELDPEHISVYSLIVEEGTPLEKMYDEGRLVLTDEKTNRKMYEIAVETFKNHGYQHYEISNFAKHGKECKHNIGYWSDKNYIGVGLGASSYIHGTRYKNITDIEEYIQASGDIDRLRKVEQEPSKARRLEEFFFLGLRKIDGISVEEINKIFSEPLENEYKDIVYSLIYDGLLELTGNTLKLTKKGVNLSNYVLAQFLLDD